MGNSIISMAIFNSYVKLPEGSFWGIATFRIMQLDCVILGWWAYLPKHQDFFCGRSVKMLQESVEKNCRLNSYRIFLLDYSWHVSVILKKQLGRMAYTNPFAGLWPDNCSGAIWYKDCSSSTSWEPEPRCAKMRIPAMLAYQGVTWKVCVLS